MKATQRTQRRSLQQTGSGVSLFPFLAVLICTMGALVPLLLAITRTARLQAEAAAQAKMAEQSSEVQTQQDDVRWRIEQLKLSRAQTESQVSDARLQLGHIEDHSRRLRDRLAQYERTVGDLERLENVDQRQQTQLQAELGQVREQLKTAAQELSQAHEAAAGRKRCYAVVPYEGPNQTRRRPIYLECREDAVVLQPEGVALQASDFDGPLGPGNPLAVALRAAREYMLSQRNFDPEAGEPYPMLLVRPEGINAYYAARAAMKSWGFDFGYELVSDDWKLAYPPADPRLAEMVRQVIASARANQARLVAAAPRHYGSRQKVVYRASSTGGFIREGAPSDDDDGGYAPAPASGTVGRNGVGTRSHGASQSAPSAANPYEAVAQPYASSVQPLAASPSGNGGQAFPNTGPGIAGGTGNNPDIGTGGGTGDGVGGPMLAGNGIAPAGYPQNASGQGGYPTGNTSAGEPAFAGADSVPHPLRSNAGGAGGIAGGAADGTSFNPYRSSAPVQAGSSTGAGPVSAGGSPQGIPAGVSANATSRNLDAASRVQGSGRSGGVASAQAGERPEGYIVGQPPREQATPTAPSQACPVNSRPGYAPRPGEWQPTPEPPPRKNRDDREKEEEENEKRGGKHKKSLAEKRGDDWGLRDAARGSVGVTRPIRVECYPDRLVIVSERSTADSKVIPLGQRTESSIDTFISGVWESMEAWGIAGRGMYWRPLLQIHVAPNAERRFNDLSALLQGSGLMVERK